MISTLSEILANSIFFLIGNPFLYSSDVIHIPFIVGCIFVCVLLYDLTHMLGVLIHG